MQIGIQYFNSWVEWGLWEVEEVDICLYFYSPFLSFG